jgi:hypothetical protein
MRSTYLIIPPPIKKKGDNKYLGMIPLEALKKLDDEPFIRKSKEVED